MVKELLDNQGMKVSDLDAVAISGGPGSYTGLRIGASLAKALCYSAGIPLIAVSSLKSIACELKKQAKSGQLLCTLIDARRDDAYYGLYDYELNELIEEGFTTLGPDFLKGQKNKTVFAGSGTAKLLDLTKIQAEQIKDVNLVATSMAELAMGKLERQEFEDLAYYEPNYIKAVHITTPKKSV